MKKKCLLSLLLVLSLFLISTQVYADLFSTFDSDMQGWTTYSPNSDGWGLAGQSGWISPGGNPGGYIYGSEHSDMYDGTGYFVAPTSWSGNWNSYIGGTLKYDINIKTGGSFTPYDTVADVIICRDNSCLQWINNERDSSWSNGWVNINVTLTATTFGVSDVLFNSVMSNVNKLWIRGEYFSNYDAGERLDNVYVTPKSVPEPTTMLLLGLGLVGLAGVRRKFKK